MARYAELGNWLRECYASPVSATREFTGAALSASMTVPAGMEVDRVVLRENQTDGPSFAYSLPVHSFHTRRDRVASFTTCRLHGAAIQKSLTTRARPCPDLVIWLE